MALFSNEHGEFYNPEDFEPPRNPFAKYAELRPVMHGYDAPRRAIEVLRVVELAVLVAEEGHQIGRAHV